MLANYIAVILGIPKSIFMSFKYFNIKDAIKLPILVSNNTWIHTARGKIIVDGPIKFGMIKIGFGDIAIFDRKKSRTIWELNGVLKVKNKAYFGHGSKISIKGELVLGNNFDISCESTIICNHRIVFGDNCLLSWQILLMDTDFHKIYNSLNERINIDKSIIIGDNVWIGCRSIILKGSKINNDTVVAANSCIASDIEGEKQIIGGMPLRILKKDISWEM